MKCLCGNGCNKLQAGSTVRLFHREHECYIAAEGSFWKGITEDGTCMGEGERKGRREREGGGAVIQV